MMKEAKRQKYLPKTFIYKDIYSPPSRPWIFWINLFPDQTSGVNHSECCQYSAFKPLISPPPSPPLLTVDHDDAGDSLVLLQPLQSLVQLGPARLRGGTVRRA